MQGARSDFFVKTKQNTIILLYIVCMFFVFLNEQGGSLEDAHLTFNSDSICVLEGFGEMGKRDNYIFLCVLQFSLTSSKWFHYFCSKKKPQKA